MNARKTILMTALTLCAGLPVAAAETLRGEIWAYVHPDDGYAEALDSVRVADQRVRLANIDNVQIGSSVNVQFTVKIGIAC